MTSELVEEERWKLEEVVAFADRQGVEPGFGKAVAEPHLNAHHLGVVEQKVFLTPHKAEVLFRIPMQPEPRVQPSLIVWGSTYLNMDDTRDLDRRRVDDGVLFASYL